MTGIRVSREAASFVRREAEYLRRRNPQTATKFAHVVRRAKDTLRTFDQTGNQMHGLQIKGGRTLVIDDYLFDYLVADGTVYIIAVRHGRMLQRTPPVDLDGEDDPTPADGT